VNGQTGAVSLTTDNIPEGATNQYYLDSRARAALSFTAGSGAYNSTTGVITIPTNTSQLTNGANFITLASLSGTAPIVYNNTTGAISITQAGTASNGYLSSTDWNTFNNKSNTNGTVTSVAALTIGTTGTDLSSTVANSTTTPVITLNVPTASATNRGALSAADWTTFNNKQNALTNPVTGTGTANYHAKWTSGSAIGDSLIYDDGTNVGINTTTLTKNINLAGTTKHERIFAYGNYSANFSNSVVETFTWFRFGNATPFSQTKIYYRAGSSTSEEEGEIRVSNTCSKPFIEWTRNTYNYHIREVRARMQGGCGSCEIWVLMRHGDSFGTGTTSNLQWQIYSGTDSAFAVINATGTPGTGTEQKSINTTDGYFYNNSDNISIGGNLTTTSTTTVSQVNIGVGLLTAGRPFIGTNTDSNPLEIGNRALSSVILVTNSLPRLTIQSTGEAILSNLAGTGTRIVVADASGTLSATSALSGYVTGSGTTNYVPKWTSTSAVGNSQLFDDGTNVAIGTTDFGAYGLSLANGLNISFSEGGGTSYANIFRQRNSAATIIAHSLKRSSTAPFASSTGVSVGKAAIAVGWNAGSISFFSDPASAVANGTDFVASERMTIINSGNVGINTGTPQTKLDVYSSSGNIITASFGGALVIGEWSGLSTTS
jgi:hypothetical protein